MKQRRSYAQVLINAPYLLWAAIFILVPLFISAFRRADELSTAMECRCYHGGTGRTRMNKLRFRPADALFMLAALAICVGVGLLGRIGL